METIPHLFAVGFGGALGALSRYGIAVYWPWPTLIANGVGCLLIGLGAGYLYHIQVEWAPWLKAFLFTGFLGGFTTYSTFSLEVLQFWQDGRWSLAGGYVGATLLLCLGSVALGWTLGQTLSVS